MALVDAVNTLLANGEIKRNPVIGAVAAVSVGVYRGTPVAITSICRQKPMAFKFIEFLKTQEAHEVFKKWGWD